MFVNFKWVGFVSALKFSDLLSVFTDFITESGCTWFIIVHFGFLRSEGFEYSCHSCVIIIHQIINIGISQLGERLLIQT